MVDPTGEEGARLQLAIPMQNGNWYLSLLLASISPHSSAQPWPEKNVVLHIIQSGGYPVHVVYDGIPGVTEKYHFLMDLRHYQTSLHSKEMPLPRGLGVIVAPLQ